MILVAQGPGATPENAREILRRSSASSIEPIGEGAYRLRDASRAFLHR